MCYTVDTTARKICCTVKDALLWKVYIQQNTPGLPDWLNSDMENFSYNCKPYLEKFLLAFSKSIFNEQVKS